MESKIEMGLVWSSLFLAVFNQNSIIPFTLACLASITTIIRNLPAVKAWFQSFKKPNKN